MDQEYTLSVGIPETDFGVLPRRWHFLFVDKPDRPCVEGTDAIAGLIVINALVGEWVLRAGQRPIFCDRLSSKGKTQRVFLDSLF